MEMLFQVLFKIDNYNTHMLLLKLVQIFKYNFSVSMLGLYISTILMSGLDLCYPSSKGDYFFSFDTTLNIWIAQPNGM